MPAWVMAARALTMRPATVAAALVAVGALGAVGCDGPGVVSPRRGVVGQVGGGGAAAAVVGTWRRTIYFIDDFGYAHSSETSWQFGADGAAARVQVTRNLTFGIADVLVSAGRYRVEGTRLVIDLITPSPVQLSYEVRRTGTQLEIAGEAYLLVGG